MAGVRWVPDLTAAASATDAARRVLTVRLEAVRDRLGLTLRAADQDPEYIHQLRVSTRRAGAALRIFAPCLPEPIGRKVRRAIRRVRRAAGAARDWDIFLLGLDHEPFAKGRHPNAAAFLLGYALGHRSAALAGLVKAGDDYPFVWDRLVAETLAAVRRPAGPERILADLALPALLEQVQAFEEAAAESADDVACLHAVRIAGKRLRYAMEIFVDCFEPAFRETLYPTILEAQDLLGRLNDSRITCERLAVFASRPVPGPIGRHKLIRAGIDALRKHHERRLAKERDAFLEWWQRWQEFGGATTLHALRKPVLRSGRPRLPKPTRSPAD